MSKKRYFLRTEIDIYHTGLDHVRGDVFSFYPHNKSHIVLKHVPDKFMLIAKKNRFTKLMMFLKLW